jgi:prolyl-tRNA synthetase
VRFSEAYIPTQKEIPSDAVIPSHRLMLRAGLVRPLASGIYSYLPFGWKIMKKIMQIIREEMDAIGGQELQLPALNPIEIWDETGRNADFGDEMFRLKDRKNRPLVLAPTHEEVVCDLARKYIKSYKDLPQIWYQIQTKMRDEPRPRSGVIRTRQFIMKDSYTLDTDSGELDKAYQAHARAYQNIFTRCGLRFHIVGAASGLMGGSGSQEFMLESEHGEDTLVLCDKCGYAANMEIAVSVPDSSTGENGKSLSRVHTPGTRTISEVSSFLKKEPRQLMKSLVYIRNSSPVMILVRGDHEVNESKLQAYLGGTIRPAHPDEVRDICGADIGFIGPIGLSNPLRLIADNALENLSDLTTGANKNDYHLTGIKINRDVHVKEFGDLRNVTSGERCVQCGKPLKISNAIELGHIFKLGTKYSKSMKAFYLDRSGKERPIVMGSYGIGVERILAAYIEQNHDKNGIIWNSVLNPAQVHILPVNRDKSDILEIADSLYRTLKAEGYDVLIDDRPLSPGYKFKEADLLGIPLQIIVGETWLKKKELEIKERRSGERSYCSIEGCPSTISRLFENIK